MPNNFESLQPMKFPMGQSKEYRDNWERIFGKKEESGSELATVADHSLEEAKSVSAEYEEAASAAFEQSLAYLVSHSE